MKCAFSFLDAGSLPDRAWRGPMHISPVVVRIAAAQRGDAVEDAENTRLQGLYRITCVGRIPVRETVDALKITNIAAVPLIAGAGLHILRKAQMPLALPRNIIAGVTQQGSNIGALRRGGQAGP